MKIRLRKFFTPTLYLFQVGKVGSKSLKATLDAQYPGKVIHAHEFWQIPTRYQSRLQWAMRLGLPVRVICPIRDPLSRNMSAFFQHFERLTGRSFEEKDWSVEEMTALFIEKYPHHFQMEWFDRELRTAFGIDVFAQKFDKVRKWQTYQKGSVQMLIYRTDLDHDAQLDAVAQFLGLPLTEWTVTGETSKKAHGSLYSRTSKEAKLPMLYLQLLCDASSCRHFWTEKEIEQLKARWS